MSSERKHVFILVNGILTRPGASDGWCDRGVTWLHLKTESRAEKFEYAAGALTRRLWQHQRAQAIANMVGHYHRAGYQISFVGHSNGCDLIARVLELTTIPAVSAHLFAPAAESDDFDWQLGLHLGHLFLYASAGDRALKLAGLSRKLFGWAGLGYGDLGRRVPADLLESPRVTLCRRDHYGHSTWFERGVRFEETMRLLLKNEFSLST